MNKSKVQGSCSTGKRKSCEKATEDLSTEVSSDISRFDVREDLRKALEKGKMSDVTFKVKGQIFAAHRLILAVRSPVFKAELFVGSTARTSTGTQKYPIIIKDMEPDVFRSLPQYIYTNSVPKINEKKDERTMAQHLLVAADRYALEGLKLICEEKLCNVVSLDNIASSLALARRHNFVRLKEVVLNLLQFANKENIVDLLLNNEFVKLLHDSPSLLAKQRFVPRNQN